MKLQDLMKVSGNYETLTIFREQLKASQEQDHQITQVKRPIHSYIPGDLAGKRVKELKELLKGIVETGDLEGVTAPQFEVIWATILKGEKEFAKEIMLRLQSKVKLGRRFIEEVLEIHGTAFWSLTSQEDNWSRYEEVVTGIWNRILDVKGVYRKIEGKVQNPRRSRAQSSETIQVQSTGSSDLEELKRKLANLK